MWWWGASWWCGASLDVVGGSLCNSLGGFLVVVWWECCREDRRPKTQALGKTLSKRFCYRIPLASRQLPALAFCGGPRPIKTSAFRTLGRSAPATPYPKVGFQLSHIIVQGCRCGQIVCRNQIESCEKSVWGYMLFFCISLSCAANRLIHGFNGFQYYCSAN